MSEKLIIKNLSAAYGNTKILHSLNLQIESGNITALLGANGAGKTSLLRAISGMLSLEGLMKFGDHRIDQMSTEDIARLGIGHVPDGRGTFSELSVIENLYLGAIQRNDKSGIDQDLYLIHDYFPVLKRRTKQQAGTLSGGEQQMLAVGRALMARPRLLLLDEPSFGLAPLVVREIFNIFKKLNQEQNMSILLVEQNAHLATDIAHKAYLLETGHIVFSGTAEEVMKNNSIQKAYLGKS
jgi:branched-chain amino acid transport system ATP-binding protein